MNDPESPPTESQILRAVVADCVERWEDDGETAVAAACRAHPELAAEIRARISALREVGLLGQATPAQVPERLGQFRLRQRLGGGGMGVVYLAQDERLGRQVALKLIRPEHLYFEGARDRFRREVEAVARLKHPAIVPVYSVGEEQGIPFFAMEHVEGVTLAAVVAALRGRKPETLDGADLWRVLAARLPALAEQHPDRAPDGSASRRVFGGTWTRSCLAIAREIADALHHAHDAGVLHRDVKPSNVMITAHGRVVLLDFGLASVEGSAPLTRSLSQLGSLPYVAPEQLRGKSQAQITPRSDLYALGLLLHELLTLNTPDPDESPLVLRQRILEGRRPTPRALNPAIPRDAETVCLTAIAVDPADRYESCALLARDLDNVLDLRPIDARRLPAWMRAARWLERHPRTAGAAAVVLIAVFVGTALLAQQARAANAQIRTRSDALLAIGLVAKADELWPAVPDRVPRMTAWLADFAALRGRVPEYADRLRDAQGASTPDAERQWAIETLSEIVAQAKALAPVAEAVAARRAVASTLRQRTVEEPAQAWDRVVGEIADATLYPCYGGLKLAPQLGLVPLGRDPESRLQEFAHVLSGAVPARDPSTGKLVLGEEHGIVLVLLPGGTFRMGSPPVDADGSGDQDPDALGNERPAHEVTLAPFFLGKHEVTQGQWQRLTGANPSGYRAGANFAGTPITLLHPVERISHDDGTRWLGRMALALPTEAQWEYAARAGSRGPWWTGSDVASLAGAANVADRAALRVGIPPETGADRSLDDGFALHAPVGIFRANPFGLHDMIGNVQEWCRDGFARYGQAPPRAGDGLRPRDAQGPAADEYIVRGGSYGNRPADGRSAWRSLGTGDNRSLVLGLRAARAIDPAPAR